MMHSKPCSSNMKPNKRSYPYSEQGLTSEDTGTKRTVVQSPLDAKRMKLQNEQTLVETTQTVPQAQVSQQGHEWRRLESQSEFHNDQLQQLQAYKQENPSSLHSAPTTAVTAPAILGEPVSDPRHPASLNPLNESSQNSLQHFSSQDHNDPAILRSSGASTDNSSNPTLSNPLIVSTDNDLAPDGSTNSKTAANRINPGDSVNPSYLKSRTFHQMHRKYGPELDYMLIEFKKLERQLLGAPIHQQHLMNVQRTNPPKEEPKESRERREKLHAFILHLEDTLRQIAEGCESEKSERQREVTLFNQEHRVEEEKKLSDSSLQQPEPNAKPNIGIMSDTICMEGSLTSDATPKLPLPSLFPDRKSIESIQRIEDHIITNLLPVKLRLTRQLAAQKGATKNPVTAPVRAGITTPVNCGAVTGGTIAEVVEAKRKLQAEEYLKRQLQRQNLTADPLAPVESNDKMLSELKQPIEHAGSSLTARLHGGVFRSTINRGIRITGVPSAQSNSLSTNAGNGDAKTTTPSKRPILYAGMAWGSNQVPSSVKAVSIHRGLIAEVAAKAVAFEEEDSKQLKHLEDTAVRVAFGNDAITSSIEKEDLSTKRADNLAKISSSEGSATLAAHSREVTLPTTNRVAKIQSLPYPNKQALYNQSCCNQGDQLRNESSMAINTAANTVFKFMPINNARPAYPQQPLVKPINSKNKHHCPDFDDPTLTAERRFELGLKEARWRQGNRRKLRRRQRLEGYIYRQTNDISAFPQSSQHHSQDVQQGSNEKSYFSSHAPILNTITAPSVGSLGKTNKDYGSRTVEYICALCNETFMYSCERNPWWALTNCDCPKCGKLQIPRLDISAPANAIDYHPALLAESETAPSASPNSKTSISADSQQLLHTRQQISLTNSQLSFSESEVSHTDESDGEGGSGSYAESKEEEEYDSNVLDSTGEDRVEREEFGFDYKGETLSEDQSTKLLILIEHASICPGRHLCAKHRNVCHSTKYMMLHVRDCNGFLSNGDICPFPWCRKTKHLLYHLVTCTKDASGKDCSICCPRNLSSNLTDLVGLNNYRRKLFVERAKAIASALVVKRRQLSDISQSGSGSHYASNNLTKTDHSGDSSGSNLYK